MKVNQIRKKLQAVIDEFSLFDEKVPMSRILKARSAAAKALGLKPKSVIVHASVTTRTPAGVVRFYVDDDPLSPELSSYTFVLED